MYIIRQSHIYDGNKHINWVYLNLLCREGLSFILMLILIALSNYENNVFCNVKIKWSHKTSSFRITMCAILPFAKKYAAQYLQLKFFKKKIMVEKFM